MADKGRRVKQPIVLPAFYQENDALFICLSSISSKATYDFAYKICIVAIPCPAFRDSCQAHGHARQTRGLYVVGEAISTAVPYCDTARRDAGLRAKRRLHAQQIRRHVCFAPTHASRQRMRAASSAAMASRPKMLGCTYGPQPGGCQPADAAARDARGRAALSQEPALAKLRASAAATEVRRSSRSRFFMAAMSRQMRACV